MAVALCAVGLRRGRLDAQADVLIMNDYAMVLVDTASALLDRWVVTRAERATDSHVIELATEQVSFADC